MMVHSFAPVKYNAIRDRKIEDRSLSCIEPYSILCSLIYGKSDPQCKFDLERVENPP